MLATLSPQVEVTTDIRAQGAQERSVLHQQQQQQHRQSQQRMPLEWRPLRGCAPVGAPPAAGVDDPSGPPLKKARPPPFPPPRKAKPPSYPPPFVPPPCLEQTIQQEEAVAQANADAAAAQAAAAVAEKEALEAEAAYAAMAAAEATAVAARAKARAAATFFWSEVPWELNVWSSAYPSKLFLEKHVPRIATSLGRVRDTARAPPKHVFSAAIFREKLARTELGIVVQALEKHRWVVRYSLHL